MATNVTDVYESFLANVSDYRLAQLPPDELEETLLLYLQKAKSKFLGMEKSLFLNVTDDGTYFCKEENNSKLPVTLTDLEIEVLSTLMTVEYLRPQVLSTKVLSQHLSDKDFKINSQANHLKELSQVYKQMKKESASLLSKHSYLHLRNED